MKSRLLRGVALIALMTSPAVAADFSFKAPQGEPASVHNWTGFYVGLNAGGALARSGDPTTTISCASAPGYGFPYFANCPDAPVVAAAGTGSMSKAAFVGGGQAGYNWQVNAVVFGGEVDFDSFHARLSRTGSGVLPFAGGTFTITSSASTDVLFTARGRIGWAFDNLLLYGTGGLAETKLSASNLYADTSTPPGPGIGAWNASAIKIGWTAGGGLEWALNRNWSVKAEYLFVKFGSINASGIVISGSLTGYGSAINTSTDLTAQIARAGFNYKF